jgi:hypothetical protein
MCGVRGHLVLSVRCRALVGYMTQYIFLRVLLAQVEENALTTEDKKRE